MNSHRTVIELEKYYPDQRSEKPFAKHGEEIFCRFEDHWEIRCCEKKKNWKIKQYASGRKFHYPDGTCITPLEKK